jgi:putative DNA primase/helicase
LTTTAEFTDTQATNNIPVDLRELPQWVLWVGADVVDGKTGKVKFTKKPINPHALHGASHSERETWGTYEKCLAALPTAYKGWQREYAGAYRGGGIGFVFSADDPYIGIDLDNAIDLMTQQLRPWAQRAVDQLDSYTEVSPSGTGVHILVQGPLLKTVKHGTKDTIGVELYSQQRFFTMTGILVPGTHREIQERSKRSLSSTQTSY